mmetsp:Transcript_1002/g.3154  ORF Transcript_1002/g.3154 Transcript_1002/m.3154 type:complete len:315 (+) Transcript_1002:981-1925(+)
MALRSATGAFAATAAGPQMRAIHAPLWPMERSALARWRVSWATPFSSTGVVRRAWSRKDTASTSSDTARARKLPSRRGTPGMSSARSGASSRSASKPRAISGAGSTRPYRVETRRDMDSHSAGPRCIATRTPRLTTSWRRGRCTWPSRSLRATSDTSSACRYSAMSESMLALTTSTGTASDSLGDATAVPRWRRSLASARMPSASLRASGVRLTLSGGGSAMKVGVRQPSSTASARKCESMPGAAGQSMARSAAPSRSWMKAWKTWLEETMRRVCSAATSTATISRSRSVRSRDRMMARRTSWSWHRGMRSSSS